MAASHAGWWEALQAMLACHGLSPADWAAVFDGTTARFRRLQP